MLKIPLPFLHFGVEGVDADRYRRMPTLLDTEPVRIFIWTCTVLFFSAVYTSENKIDRTVDISRNSRRIALLLHI